MSTLTLMAEVLSALPMALLYLMGAIFLIMAWPEILPLLLIPATIQLVNRIERSQDRFKKGPSCR